MAKKKAAKKTTRKKTAKRKSLEGNAGRRAATPPSETGRLTKPPACPTRLTGPGAELWQKLSTRLVELQLLTDLDLEALEVLCEAWRRYQELAQFATGDAAFFITDKGYVAEHPAVRLRQTAVNTIERLWKQFGLTPLSRESLDMDMGGQSDDDLLKFAAKRA